jgi:hypothetical protein
MEVERILKWCLLQMNLSFGYVGSIIVLTGLLEFGADARELLL